MTSFNFGGFGNPTATMAPAFGSTPSIFGTGAPFGTSSFSAPATSQPSLFAGFGSDTSKSVATGFGGSSLFGNPATSTPSASFFPFGSTTTATALGPSAGSLFGSTPAVGTYQFPTKPSDQNASSSAAASQGTSTSTAATAKAGFTGTKPKEHSLNEQLHGDVFELEKTIRKYQNIQKDADEYALKDATEWDAAMRRFDDSSTKIQKQLSETFSVIETLRKNAARLRSHNLLSSRLVTNPAAYYSISASVESYFQEIVSGLQTEIEILDDELQHLEKLHDDLIRPGDRYNPLDIQATYMFLSKIVNGVAFAVDEVTKVGDEIRREVQALKGTAQPIQALQHPFLAQDVIQLSTARSLFGSNPIVASPSMKNLAAQSKSPLLQQQMNSDQQSTMFNPAMRSFTRLDSMSSGTKTSPPRGSSFVPASRLNQGFSLFGSPGI